VHLTVLLLRAALLRHRPHQRQVAAVQPYHPNLLTFRWGRMLDDLGIKRVRLHDARHSCATLMHLRQVPIAVIAAWLGHASAAFTMTV
jgi:integrase